MIWHFLLLQAGERDHHLELAMAPLVTNGAHPNVEYDKLGLRGILRFAINAGKIPFLLYRACIARMTLWRNSPSEIQR